MMSPPRTVARAFLTVVLTLSLSTTAQAWGPFTHWDMTDRELKSQGWGQRARDLVVDCNIATDLIACNWSLFFPASRRQMDPVRQLIRDAEFNRPDQTNGFHFDDLFSYNDIHTRWQQLDEWARRKVASLERDGWGPDQRNRFLCMLGIVLHAVQDFYAHSNWVLLLNGYTQNKRFVAEDFPTWDELVPNNGNWPGKAANVSGTEVMGRLQQSNSRSSSATMDGPQDGLQTGAYDNETTGAWRHRHPGGREGAVAKALALRATAQWKQRLLGYLSEKCRRDLLDSVRQGRARQAQDPGIRFDRRAVINMLLVLNSQAPPLRISERINTYVRGGQLRARIDLDAGTLDFQRGTFPGATLSVRAASEEVIDRILASPQPIIAAQQAVRRGEFLVSRP